MSSDRRRLLIMAGAVLVIGAAGWRFVSSSGTGVAATGRAAPERRGEPAGAEALPRAEAMSVDIDMLGRSAQDPPESRRNLFRFGAARPAAVQEPPAPAFTPVPPPPGVAPKPVDTAPAVQPIPLKFLGTLEKSSDGVKLAVLSLNDGRAPLHGREGDIIDGRYRIIKIGAESIEMAHLDGRGKQAIRLSGQ